MRARWLVVRLGLLGVVAGAVGPACAADAGDPLKDSATGGGPGGGSSGDDGGVTSTASGGATTSGASSGDISAGSGTTSSSGSSGASSSGSGTSSGGTSSGGSEAGVVSCAPNCKLELQYLCSYTAAMSSQIGMQFSIINNGTVAQDLSGITVRYYFTADGLSGFVMNCDYSPTVCPTATFVPLTPSTSTADTYMELSFSGLMLPPGGSTGETQLRVHDAQFDMLNQSNDYSFDPGDTALTDSMTMTMYSSGTLIWGTPP